MDAAFWLRRWEENRVGFHQGEINRWLRRWWDGQDLAAPVLVPLCGKSRDMLWLAEQGHWVHGVEISPLAIRQFFDEQHCQPSMQVEGPFVRLAHGRVSLYQGDFFEVGQLGRVYERVYDRAALIALPAAMRIRYAALLARMVAFGGQVLLITLEYQPEQRVQPPFSVTETEVRRLFEAHFSVERLGAQRDRYHPGVLSGQLMTMGEVCYRLVRRVGKNSSALT